MELLRLLPTEGFRRSCPNTLLAGDETLSDVRAGNSDPAENVAGGADRKGEGRPRRSGRSGSVAGVFSNLRPVYLWTSLLGSRQVAGVVVPIGRNGGGLVDNGVVGGGRGPEVEPVGVDR